jgi:hypothetical protein
MGNKEKTPLVIDNVEYDFHDLSEQQKILVNHVADLDRKIASARWNADQMQVGRDAFFAMLKQSLSVESDKPQE